MTTSLKKGLMLICMLVMIAVQGAFFPLRDHSAITWSMLGGLVLLVLVIAVVFIARARSPRDDPPH